MCAHERANIGLAERGYWRLDITPSLYITMYRYLTGTWYGLLPFKFMEHMHFSSTDIMFVASVVIYF